MTTLFQALQVLPVLEDLNISFNQLSSSSKDLGQALNMYLESSKVIRRLDIQACNISDLICQFVGLAMNTNRSLNFLDISDNQITSEGANILLDSLQYNNIHELDLSGNCISTDGQTLQRIFAANNHLASLNLNSGAINSGSISGIVVRLNGNKILQDLTLDFSQCNPSVLRILLAESNTHLVRISHSDLLSFLRTNSGWKVDLKSSIIEAINFIQNCFQADLNNIIDEVTVSNNIISVPTRLDIHLRFRPMIGVISSLESCSTLNTLCLNIDGDLQYNSEVLGNALERII